jgi:hypothetical protein
LKCNFIFSSGSEKANLPYFHTISSPDSEQWSGHLIALGTITGSNPDNRPQKFVVLKGQTETEFVCTTIISKHKVTVFYSPSPLQALGFALLSPFLHPIVPSRFF